MRDRVILDTGTLVSALVYPNRLCGMALRHAMARYELAGSARTLSHFVRILRDDVFGAWRAIDERAKFAELVADATARFEPRHPFGDCGFAVRSNVMYAELAVDSGAACLVSSQRDVLGLGGFRGTRFVSPAEFLALY